MRRAAPHTCNKPRSNCRTGRTTAKSGCRTCKIRKVKCDEEHPACRRCVSTGRVCSGYGIWGGGGDFFSQRRASPALKNRTVTPWAPSCVSILTDGREEQIHLEWFKNRTAIKLPGAFVLAFWDTLLLQAAVTEPPVLHAVLTLGAVHRRDTIGGKGQSRVIPDEQEKFMLQHYVQAIRHLRPHFSVKDRASTHVALITCVVFVCLEFLRGNFQTAELHLENGLQVLNEMQSTTDLETGTLHVRPPRHSVDTCLVAVLSRLHLEVELFKLGYQHRCVVIQTPGPGIQTSLFHSVNEAWQHMERLLIRVLHLTELRRRQPRHRSTIAPVLVGNQQHLQTDLASWLDTYEASKKYLQIQDTRTGGLAFQLLREYHTMAIIIAKSCLRQDDESIFDSYTEQFVSIIRQSVTLWKIGSSEHRPLPFHQTNMSRSMVGIGWIPPLYYTALKCRNHRVRLQAIRLLESASHREGIWDSKIAACIARKVMELEENDFYGNVDTADDFQLSSIPKQRDLSLPSLPQPYRIHELQVVLSNGPMDSVELRYRRTESSVTWNSVQVPI